MTAAFARRHWGWLAAAAAVVAVAVAVLATRGGSPRLQHLAGTQDYLPGLAADVFLPDQATASSPPVPGGVPRRAPVVVLVPGGSWQTADPTGLRPLADRLAGAGMVAVTARYRAADDGVRFPVPVSDVVCAIDFAVHRARAAGLTPGPVVVLGHSAGAQLAALAALATSRFRAGCPYPAARVDALIGLAGPYDVMSMQGVARHLFGASAADDPRAWRSGNPTTWVRNRPDLPALLAHGADDTLVSPMYTKVFAQRLEAAGHRVRVEIVPGADHATIYQADVIAQRVITWIEALPAS
jgi:acetyl esterase/lipase